MEDTFPGSDHDLGINDSDSEGRDEEKKEGWNTETCKQLTTAGMQICVTHLCAVKRNLLMMTTHGVVSLELSAGLK